MNDIKEFFMIIVAPVLGILLAAIFFMFMIASAIGNWKCSNYGEESGLETKHSALVCYVKRGESWITKRQYDLTFIASEKK